MRMADLRKNRFSADGGVFCSSLLQFSRAMSSLTGAVTTLTGLFGFAGPVLFRKGRPARGSRDGNFGRRPENGPDT